MKNILPILSILSVFAFVSSCGDDEPIATEGDFTLHFEHVFGDQSFALGTEFTTGSDEKVTINLFRYYVSNIKLEKTDGTVWAEDESYHLIELGQNENTELTLSNVPVGDYHKISFLIGVDSVRNVSGAQEGALSVSNNMFWSWNTGYIFFKVEGSSAASSNGNIKYHVGGFAGANNAIREFDHHMHNEMLMIKGEAVPEMHFMVDVKKVFDGANAIKVAEMNHVHMPGMMATKLADNFITAFSLDHIHQ